MNQQIEVSRNDRYPERRSFESLMFEGSTIRTVIQDGEVWLAGADVCRALGIVNPTRGLSGLDADEKMTLHLAKGHCAGQRGGARSLTYINEPGVYRLTMRSDKPKAKAFTRWLAHEVLPAIRRTGHYMIPSAKDAETAAAIWDTTIGMDGAHVLGELVNKKVRGIPKALQHSARMTLWSRLHTRFNVARAELIPADQMDAAANFLAAYVHEGVVEDKANHRMKPVVFTMPHQYGQPDGVGMPRTRKAMEKILFELQDWGHENLPAREVRESFTEALRQVLKLETTCWTEIDESLVRLSGASHGIQVAMEFLNRWQDRGGRIGNVG